VLQIRAVVRDNKVHSYHKRRKVRAELNELPIRLYLHRDLLYHAKRENPPVAQAVLADGEVTEH
jgi:hypothetical protein